MSFNEDSHFKGKQFENFVQNVLFPSSHYKILHKTNDFEQNSQRFVASTLKPDFKFQSLVTGEEFYVEAKYRSKTYNDRYQILSNRQFASFPELSKSTPIYIAYGYGGEANEPEFVSLLPYYVQIEKRMTPQKVIKYNIEKQAVQVSDLPITTSDTTNVNEIIENDSVVEESKKEPLVGKAPEKVTATNKAKYGYKNLIVGTVLVTIILIVFSSFFLQSSEDKIDYKAHLQDKVITYYKHANSYEFDSLKPFFDTRVSWYGKAKMKPKEIIASAKEGLKSNPFIQSIVDIESIKVFKQQDGDYYVTYDMVYKTKEKQEDPYDVYNLDMKTYWDSNFKLKQVSEVRK